MAPRIPVWRGFNLTELCSGRRGQRFVESDFAWMAEWGFNFARLPLSCQPARQQAHCEAAQHVGGQRAPGKGAGLDRAQPADVNAPDQEAQPRPNRPAEGDKQR